MKKKSLPLLMLSLMLLVTSCMSPEEQEAAVKDVLANLTLPAEINGPYEVSALEDKVSIVWSTDNPNVRVQGPDNDKYTIKVQQSVSENRTGTVKATATLKNYTESKDFTFTIKNTGNLNDEELEALNFNNYVDAFVLPFPANIDKNFTLSNQNNLGIKIEWELGGTTGNYKHLSVTNNEDGSTDFVVDPDPYADKKITLLKAIFSKGENLSAEKEFKGTTGVTVLGLGLTKFEDAVEDVHNAFIADLPEFLASEDAFNIPKYPYLDPGVKFENDGRMVREVSIKEGLGITAYDLELENETYTATVNNQQRQAGFLTLSVNYVLKVDDVDKVIIFKEISFVVAEEGATTPSVLTKINAWIPTVSPSYTLPLGGEVTISLPGSDEYLTNANHERDYLTSLVVGGGDDKWIEFSGIAHPYLDKDVPVTIVLDLFGIEFEAKTVIKVKSEGGEMPEFEDMVVYETGFEADEGFATTKSYTQPAEILVGPSGKQWAFSYGGITSASGYQMKGTTGTQSATIRHVAASQTLSEYHYARTTFKIERPISVSLKSYWSNSAVVNILYSTDASNWTVGITYTAKANGSSDEVRTFDFPAELINNSYYIMIQLDAEENLSEKNHEGAFDDISFFGRHYY